MHLERLALILEIVGQKGRASVADICAQSDIPKPTAYRLVQDLVSSGLLESPTRGEFAIGTRLKRITLSDHSDPALLQVIAPVLSGAANDYGAAFFLSRLRSHWVEIIHVETPQTGVSFLHPGMGKRPMHACSCAKAIAAVSPELLSQDRLDGQLKRYTDRTITDPKELAAELDVIRAKGYAMCVEELERGISSVATTLTKTGVGATLSIGATASLRVFTPSKREKIGHTLTTMSHELARALGWDEADEERISA
ncbi:helix-turn-helix domain-containing protein [Ruegeria conchae]|uniref:IclR family transcriptional regulator n=1 Tax=Ruegeria conchae TaxID=981384 RepID=UPI0021A364B9|nr:IclR family transcriptional regulator C-terminal domain-containing protein [Ruegeria conchae]UWR01936.1 helix-turn-helix domain-containing protein [Ruegeria conchae]UWR03980.1 helix-turn-helix domain-containing protein [Ruegeria conchae]